MKIIYDRGTLLLNQKLPSSTLAKFSCIKWDARTKNYRAPAYVYRDLRKYLNDKHIPLELFHFQMEKGLNAHEWKQVELRYYQKAALDSWEVQGRRGTIVFPTGAGKTIIAIEAIKRLNVPAICLVPTRVLLHQWTKQIQSFYSGEVGILGEGMHRLCPITVATYESAYRNASHLGDKFKLVIVDEAHHFGRGVKDEILELSMAPYRLGLTATLSAADKSFVRALELIGDIVYKVETHDLLGQYLANYFKIPIHLPLNQDERIQYKKNMDLFKDLLIEFNHFAPGGNWATLTQFANQDQTGKEALSAYFRAKKICGFTAHKREMLEKLLKRYKHRKILIFTHDTETAYKISRQFFIFPITSHITKKEREDVLDLFSTGKINAIVSCKVLNEGYDLPAADMIIIVGGTSGQREQVQRIGRILRPSENKIALVFELVSAQSLEIRQWKKRNGLA